MKNLFFCLLFMSLNSYSQETHIGFSYEYLYCPQFDKAIQTYNFDRPFLNEKQPLFLNGINTNINHTFKNDKNYKQGVSVGYSYFRSEADNVNFNKILNLHLVQIGYVLNFKNAKRFKGFYETIQINCVLGGLFKNINDSPAYIEEKRVKSLGIGGEIKGLLGYNFKKISRLSPFISMIYSPYYYSPNSEALLNDTKGLIKFSYLNYFKMNVGIIFKISKI